MSKRERMRVTEKWQEFGASNFISSLYTRRNCGMYGVGEGQRGERERQNETKIFA